MLLSRRLHLEECSGIMVIFQILESEQSLQSLLILITPSRTELLKKLYLILANNIHFRAET